MFILANILICIPTICKKKKIDSFTPINIHKANKMLN